MIGVAIGYVLGSRAGRERYEQIKSGASKVAQTRPCSPSPAVPGGGGPQAALAASRTPRGDRRPEPPARLAAPVPPGTGWPGDPAAETPVAGAAQVRGSPGPPLAELDARVSVCRACPRLVRWREDVARDKRAAYPTSPTGAGRSRAGARRRRGC